MKAATVAIRWPMPALLASVAALGSAALFARLQIADPMLDVFTGGIALWGAVLALGRLALGDLEGQALRYWQGLLAVCLVLALGEFADAFNQSIEESFGIERFDNFLMLAVAPASLWFGRSLSPAPRWALVSLLIGFGLQILSTWMGFLPDTALHGFADLDDLIQLFAAQAYLVAMLLAVLEVTQRHSRTRRPVTVSTALVRRVTGRSYLLSGRVHANLAPPPIPRLRHFAAGAALSTHLHGIAVRTAWGAARWVERAAFTGALLAWPLVALYLAIRTTWRSGAGVTAASGKSALRQMGEQMALALGHSIPPTHYYVFELWRDALRARAGEYLLRGESKYYLTRMVRDRGRARPTSMPFHSKHRLIEHCTRAGIRAVPYFAVFNKGEVFIQTAPLDAMLAGDLFVKPVVGKGGRGAETWRRVGQGGRDGVFVSDKGPRLDGEALIAHFIEASRKDGLVVQPRVANHPAFGGLALDALCTLRILTCENERGEVEVTNAVLRMPRRPGAVVDNFHAGGIAAAVDLATGRVGPATDLGTRADSAWHRTHPETGAVIDGLVLPFWPETLDLARRAHRAISDREIVGWDIAILEDGPSIVEGNGAADLDILQRTALAPVGEARIGQILGWRLDKVLRTQTPARALTGVPGKRRKPSL